MHSIISRYQVDLRIPWAYYRIYFTMKIFLKTNFQIEGIILIIL